MILHFTGNPKLVKAVAAKLRGGNTADRRGRAEEALEAIEAHLGEVAATLQHNGGCNVGYCADPDNLKCRLPRAAEIVFGLAGTHS